MLTRIRPIEVLAIEVVIYLLFWLFYEYLATLMSIVFGTIFFLILIVSLLVEWIEKSKVPRWYYYFMLASVMAPIVAALIYMAVNRGLDWMK